MQRTEHHEAIYQGNVAEEATDSSVSVTESCELGPVQTFVSPGAIRATVAVLLPICIVYVNTLLVQKGLSEKEWIDRMQPEIIVDWLHCFMAISILTGRND